MIDLDAYDARLRFAIELASSRERQVGLRHARMVLAEMRAAALPSAAAPALPAMNGTATTQAMRRAAFPRSGSIRLAILHEIVTVPLGFYPGLTDDQLEENLGRSHQSVSAARNRLVTDGWLRKATYDNGTARTRPTRSGNQACIWEITAAAVTRLRQESGR